MPEKKDSKKDEIILTKGSRYLLKSLESRDKPQISQGTFRGYTAVGPDDALCIELDATHETDQGRLRIIPCHMIISIDILEAKVEDEDPKDEIHGMYG